jgi:hypothetical protein
MEWHYLSRDQINDVLEFAARSLDAQMDQECAAPV